MFRSLEMVVLSTALFFSVNTSKAQVDSSSVSRDSLRTYNIKEVIVEQSNMDKELKNDLNLMDDGRIKAIHSNDPVKAISDISGTSSLIPYVSSRFSLHNLDFSQFGMYVVDGVGINNSGNQMFGAISNFNPHLVESIDLLKTNYSVKYDGLAGVAIVKFKKPDTQKFNTQLSVEPLDLATTVSVPLSFVSGANMSSYRNIQPWRFIEKIVPELEILPNINEYSDYLSLFDGNFTVNYRRAIEQDSYQDGGSSSNTLNENSISETFIMRHELKFENYTLTTHAAYEYNDLISKYRFLDNQDQVAVGMTNYTLATEIVDAGNMQSIGIEKYSVNSKGLDENKLTRYTADEIYQEMQKVASGKLSPYLIQVMDQKYYDVSPDKRYSALRNADEKLIELFEKNNIQNQDIKDNLLRFKQILAKPEKDGDNNNIKHMEAIKLWAEKKIVIGNILLEQSIGATKLTNASDILRYLGGINATYFFKESDIGLGYMHTANFWQRNNGLLGDIFPQDPGLNSNIADHYSTSFNERSNSFLGDINIMPYLTDLHANYRGSQKHLIVRGVDISAKTKGLTSYGVAASLSKTDMDNDPIPGTINDMINFEVARMISERVMLFSQLRMHDGVYSASGKLKPSTFLSVGGEFAFDFLGQKNLKAALGAYNILKLAGVETELGVVQGSSNTITEPFIIMANFTGAW